MYELEYLMEKAFSEGYEYAQREFAKGAARAAYKARQQKALNAMLERDYGNSYANYGKSLQRELARPDVMTNATYLSDAGITDSLGKLNVKISNQMPRNNMVSWSGAHGTTLGNARG